MFLGTMTGGLLAAPLAAEGQQPAKVPRIGILSAGAASAREEALRQGLRELGYIEGQNVVIEPRYAEDTKATRRRSLISSHPMWPSRYSGRLLRTSTGTPSNGNSPRTATPLLPRREPDGGWPR